MLLITSERSSVVPNKKRSDAIATFTVDPSNFFTVSSHSTQLRTCSVLNWSPLRPKCATKALAYRK